MKSDEKASKFTEIGTYLLTMYGVVVGGGFFVLNQAAKNQALGGGQGRPRQVQCPAKNAKKMSRTDSKWS